MKDFQDFLDLLDNEEYQTIVFSAKQAMAVSGYCTADTESYFIALELLKRYHNWLAL